jgi:hypothetical protein
MKMAIMELSWHEFRQKIINWWNKRRNDQLARVERAQERSISILQQRFGYTREKAKSELIKHYSKARLG